MRTVCQNVCRLYICMHEVLPEGMLVVGTKRKEELCILTRYRRAGRTGGGTVDGRCTGAAREAEQEWGEEQEQEHVRSRTF